MLLTYLVIFVSIFNCYEQPHPAVYGLQQMERSSVTSDRFSVPKSLPSCSSGQIHEEVILSGGINAGGYKEIGDFEEDATCLKKCCEATDCDVAFMLGKTCYLVTCIESSSCEIQRARPSSLKPRLSFSERWNTEGVRRTLFGNDRTLPWKRNFCPPLVVRKDVTVEGGVTAGVFTDAGKVSSLEQCYDICCQTNDCSLAFMLAKNCFTISCMYPNPTSVEMWNERRRNLSKYLHFPEAVNQCRLEPARKSSPFSPQAALVLRRLNPSTISDTVNYEGSAYESDKSTASTSEIPSFSGAVHIQHPFEYHSNQEFLRNDIPNKFLNTDTSGQWQQMGNLNTDQYSAAALTTQPIMNYDQISHPTFAQQPTAGIISNPASYDSGWADVASVAQSAPTDDHSQASISLENGDKFQTNQNYVSTLETNPIPHAAWFYIPPSNQVSLPDSSKDKNDFCDLSGRIYKDVSLAGGSNAGTITPDNLTFPINDTSISMFEKCRVRCCQSLECNVALLMNDERKCYRVTCTSQISCTPILSNSLFQKNTTLAFVRPLISQPTDPSAVEPLRSTLAPESSKDVKATKDEPSTSPVNKSKNRHEHESSKDISIGDRDALPSTPSPNHNVSEKLPENEVSDKKLMFRQKSANKNDTNKKNDTCLSNAIVYYNKTVTGGRAAGTYQKTSKEYDTMDKCIDLCCLQSSNENKNNNKKTACNMAIMIGSKCYLVHLSSPKLCELDPINPAAVSKLKYVPSIAIFQNRDISKTNITETEPEISFRNSSDSSEPIDDLMNSDKNVTTTTNKPVDQSFGNNGCIHGAIIPNMTVMAATATWMREKSITKGVMPKVMKLLAGGISSMSQCQELCCLDTFCDVSILRSDGGCMGVSCSKHPSACLPTRSVLNSVIIEQDTDQAKFLASPNVHYLELSFLERRGPHQSLRPSLENNVGNSLDYDSTLEAIKPNFLGRVNSYFGALVACVVAAIVSIYAVIKMKNKWKVRYEFDKANLTTGYSQGLKKPQSTLSQILWKRAKGNSPVSGSPFRGQIDPVDEEEDRLQELLTKANSKYLQNKKNRR